MIMYDDTLYTVLFCIEICTVEKKCAILYKSVLTQAEYK